MKRVFLALAFLIMLSITPFALAQLSLGQPALQKQIEIVINENNEVHVTHEVQNSSVPQSLILIKGTVSELKVMNLDGDEKEFGVSEGIDGSTTITIFPTNEIVKVEYDLDDALSLKNGVWTWEYLYLNDSKFNFPDNIKIIYVNENPVIIEGVNSISCHGCQMLLEYVIDMPTIHEQIEWEDEEFLISVETLAEISSINFNQPSKSISFQINDENSLVNLIIPKEFLGNPYQVFLDDSKILKHEYLTNETHTWLNIKPSSQGTIQIIGTTVIPEFSLFVPLVMGMLIVVAIQMKNKITLR